MGLQDLPLYHPAYWPTWLGLAFMRVITFLPMPVLWVLGTALGTVMHLIPSKVRKVVRTNIRLCFPELGGKGRRRLVRKHFRTLGVSMLCYGIAWWASAARLRRLVTFRDRHHYDAVLAAGRSVIVFAP